MKQNFFKIVLTGPESSGKTTLAAALATALDTVYVPEFARIYLENLGRPYIRDDLSLIAAGQLELEQHYAPLARRYLVCDTDWTVIQVWDYYRFRFSGLEYTGLGVEGWTQIGLGGIPDFAPVPLPDSGVFYFLCAPDFPWQPDPLREHPEERHILFGLYERLLQNLDLPYVVLRGTEANRLEQATAIILSLP